MRQRHAVTLPNDALWAAIADPCPCGKPNRGLGATARKGRAQMEYLPRYLYGAAAPRSVRALALRIERTSDLPSGDSLDWGGRPDRLSVQRQADFARARHACFDVAPAPRRP